MAYALATAFNLGPSQTGIAANLRAQLVDTTGADVGSAVSTGFVEIGTSGNYLWYYASFPDGHRGGVKIYNSGAPSTFLGFVAINPEEAENVNVKTSTRSSHAAADIWSVGTRSLTTFGTLVADVWSHITRTITGGTVSTVSDKTGYSLATNQTYNNAGQTTILPANVYGMQEGTITALAVAANAIDASALAADAVTEIQSGLATSASQATSAATIAKLETMLVADGAVHQFTANALELASGGTGDGDTAVDHDTGGAANMTVVDWAGNGIDGATIRAYLTSEYATGASAATVRGITRSNSSGEWVAPLLLDSGVSYTIVVTKPDGETLPGTKVITVP